MNFISRCVLTFGLTLMIGCCAMHPKKEGAERYLDDSAITTKVKSAILGDPSLKVMQIAVETYQGRVQLSGFVDSPQSVRRAEEVAKRVEGVKEVSNNLIVK